MKQNLHLLRVVGLNWHPVSSCAFIQWKYLKMNNHSSPLWWYLHRSFRVIFVSVRENTEIHKHIHISAAWKQSHEQTPPTLSSRKWFFYFNLICFNLSEVGHCYVTHQGLHKSHDRNIIPSIAHLKISCCLLGSDRPDVIQRLYDDAKLRQRQG